MPENLDPVAHYASSLGYKACPKIVLLEGTSDVSLFKMAAEYELTATGRNILGDQVCLIAAGEGDRGGAIGIVRELMCFSGLCRSVLLSNGNPRYRVAALFDNDKAGRLSLQEARRLDASLIEFKDLFLLHPSMPLTNNLDPHFLKKVFEQENNIYKGLDWELEDLLPAALVECFEQDFPTAIARSKAIGGLTHRDYSRDGKAQLHRFTRQHAMHKDLLPVIKALEAIRCYLGLK